jgi:hypothetical protein
MLLLMQAEHVNSRRLEPQAGQAAANRLIADKQSCKPFATTPTISDAVQV